MKSTTGIKIVSLLIYPLFIILTLFSACGNASKTHLKKSETPGINYDTVTYTITTINKNDPDCDSTKDKNCRIISIKYHVFDNHPVLNDSINASLLAIYPLNQPDAPVTGTIAEKADDFMKKYEEFKKEPYSQGRKYELICSTKLLTESENLLTIQLDSYTYSGGAHGASFRKFFNYDIKNKKVVFLTDIMKDNYRDSLRSIAEIIFKKNEGLKPGEPLKPNAYFFENNKFDLANNYVFTPNGIMFLYNEYEIKPYAAGQTELLIPYDKIKHLLRQRTVIGQFVNR